MSDNTTAKWYFDNASDPDNQMFYDVFFNALRKYNVTWCNATPQERFFIEEVVRITLERRQAIEMGIPLDTIRPAFSKSA